jgi:hypothetical protein
MTVMEKLISVLARQKDTWLYVGLFCWISIGFTIGHHDPWDKYFQSLAALMGFFSPVLAVTWVREHSGQGRFETRNRRVWLACYLVYLPLLLLLSAILMSPAHFLWTVLFTGGICISMLECILVIEYQYFGRLRLKSWVLKLSLEKAVLISITGLALLLGAMAVSSLDNPLYHSSKQLLIGFEIHFLKIAARFPTFISYSLQLLLMYLAGYFFFFVNSRWLVPHILKDRGILQYVLCSGALIGITYPVLGQMLASLPFSNVLGGVFSANPFVAENAFGAMLILAVSLPVLLAIQWARQNSLITALQHEKSVAELDLLKQQLNPHFFFNTLNNLYALSLTRSEQTSESILQLSELMRYVIYKGKEAFVPIGDEVSYLENYLHLQSIRLKPSHDIRFQIDIENKNFLIAPLLLIVLIENAFKHGIEPADWQAFLHISLTVHPEKLVFTCSNSFDQLTGNQAGIGLTNLKKRLNLIYPGRHRLSVQTIGTVYEASLELTNGV